MTVGPRPAHISTLREALAVSAASVTMPDGSPLVHMRLPKTYRLVLDIILHSQARLDKAHGHRAPPFLPLKTLLQQCQSHTSLARWSPADLDYAIQLCESLGFCATWIPSRTGAHAQDNGGASLTSRPASSSGLSSELVGAASDLHTLRSPSPLLSPPAASPLAVSPVVTLNKHHSGAPASFTATGVAASPGSGTAGASDPATMATLNNVAVICVNLPFACAAAAAAIGQDKAPQGIIDRVALEAELEDALEGEGPAMLVMSLLQRSHFAVPLDQKRMLVPFRLPSSAPATYLPFLRQAPGQHVLVRRYLTAPFLPRAVWMSLLGHLIDQAVAASTWRRSQRQRCLRETLHERRRHSRPLAALPFSLSDNASADAMNRSRPFSSTGPLSAHGGFASTTDKQSTAGHADLAGQQAGANEGAAAAVAGLRRERAASMMAAVHTNEPAPAVRSVAKDSDHGHRSSHQPQDDVPADDDEAAKHIPDLEPSSPPRHPYPAVPPQYHLGGFGQYATADATADKEVKKSVSNFHAKGGSDFGREPAAAARRAAGEFATKPIAPRGDTGPNRHGRTVGFADEDAVNGPSGLRLKQQPQPRPMLSRDRGAEDDADHEVTDANDGHATGHQVPLRSTAGHGGPHFAGGDEETDFEPPNHPTSGLAAAAAAAAGHGHGISRRPSSGAGGSGSGGGAVNFQQPSWTASTRSPSASFDAHVPVKAGFDAPASPNRSSAAKTGGNRSQLVSAMRKSFADFHSLSARQASNPLRELQLAAAAFVACARDLHDLSSVPPTEASNGEDLGDSGLAFQAWSSGAAFGLTESCGILVQLAQQPDAFFVELCVVAPQDACGSGLSSGSNSMQGDSAPTSPARVPVQSSGSTPRTQSADSEMQGVALDSSLGRISAALTNGKAAGSREGTRRVSTTEVLGDLLVALCSTTLAALNNFPSLSAACRLQVLPSGLGEGGVISIQNMLPLDLLEQTLTAQDLATHAGTVSRSDDLVLASRTLEFSASRDGISRNDLRAMAPDLLLLDYEQLVAVAAPTSASGNVAEVQSDKTAQRIMPGVSAGLPGSLPGVVNAGAHALAVAAMSKATRDDETERRRRLRYSSRRAVRADLAVLHGLKHEAVVSFYWVGIGALHEIHFETGPFGALDSVLATITDLKVCLFWRKADYYFHARRIACLCRNCLDANACPLVCTLHLFPHPWSWS